MMYMEVSIQKEGLRLKSKQAVFMINPTTKTAGSNAVVFLSDKDIGPTDEETVVLSGAGEYEIGGVKITGIRSGEQVVYSFLLDGVDVLVGRIAPLEKLQNKLKEYDVVVLNTDDTNIKDAAFATGIATSVLMAYGSEAKALVDTMSKESAQTLNKFSATKDKLPQEMQTILLANS